MPTDTATTVITLLAGAGIKFIFDTILHSVKRPRAIVNAVIECPAICTPTYSSQNGFACRSTVCATAKIQNVGNITASDLTIRIHLAGNHLLRNEIQADDPLHIQRIERVSDLNNVDDWLDFTVSHLHRNDCFRICLEFDPCPNPDGLKASVDGKNLDVSCRSRTTC